MKIKGQHFRIIANSAAIPEETNCSVTITGNMESTSTKDSEGNFMQETMTSKSWQVQVDSYEGEPIQVAYLINQFCAANAQTVEFDQTQGSMNRVAANASFRRSGNALLNDLTFVFNDRATITTAIQYQGKGALS